MVLPMNLASAFAESAKKNPTKPALYWGEEEFTYQELWTQSLAVCERLQNEFGIQPGMRVALWLKNCPQFVPALFGVLETGAAVAPINNFLKPDEVNFILADAEIDLVITDLSMAEGTAKLAVLRPGLKFLHVEDFPRHPTGTARDTSCEMSESDLAIIIYTSGTTGRPKGAMLSHGNLLHNVESCRRVLETVGEDRIVVLLPMFHSFMLSVGILLPMLIGGTIVLI